MKKLQNNKKGLGFIGKLVIGIFLYGLIFMTFFTFFADVETHYGSNYNVSDPTLNVTAYESTRELETSYNQSNQSTTTLKGGTTSPSSAFDNIMNIAWGVIQTIFNPISQATHMIGYILGQVLDIDMGNYPWVYYGIYGIITALFVLAILGVIFRAQF